MKLSRTRFDLARGVLSAIGTALKADPDALPLDTMTRGEAGKEYGRLCALVDNGDQSAIDSVVECALTVLTRRVPTEGFTQL